MEHSVIWLAVLLAATAPPSYCARYGKSPDGAFSVSDDVLNDQRARRSPVYDVDDAAPVRGHQQQRYSEDRDSETSYSRPRSNAGWENRNGRPASWHQPYSFNRRPQYNFNRFSAGLGNGDVNSVRGVAIKVGQYAKQNGSIQQEGVCRAAAQLKGKNVTVPTMSLDQPEKPGYENVCCDIAILSLYNNVTTDPKVARTKREVFNNRTQQMMNKKTPGAGFCCDQRIVNMMKGLTEPPEDPANVSFSVVTQDLPSADVQLLQDKKDDVPLIAFSAAGQASMMSEVEPGNEFKQIWFKKLLYNYGESFNQDLSLFRAPVSGVYRFQLRFHNTAKEAGRVACAGIAPAATTLKENTGVTCVRPGMTGFLSVNRIARKGMEVVARYAGPIGSASWGLETDPDGLRFLEFSGMLIRPARSIAEEEEDLKKM